MAEVLKPSPGAPQAESDPQNLTLGRLLQERLLCHSRTSAPPEMLTTPVTWCLPWDEAQGTSPLDGVVIYARAEEIEHKSLDQLGRRNAAGLIIAGDGHFKSTETTVPIIHVGDHVAFRELGHLVAELVLARDTHVLRYGLTVHRSLVELLYRGAGLAALGHQMARLSGCSALILDPQYRVLASERSRDRPLEPTEVAEALRAEASDVDVDAERSHAGPHVRELVINGTDATCVFNPILLGGRHDGWVAIVAVSHALTAHDVAQHRVVVEQAATIVGTEMLRMRSVEQAEERARGDFVHALLHGRFANHHELAARAAHYEFALGATYGVVVAGRIGAAGSAESTNTMFQLARQAARLDGRPGAQTFATVVGDMLAVIRQIDPAGRRDSPDAEDKALADFARTLETEIERRVHHRVAIAYGRCVIGASNIFDSYREARIALALRTRLAMDRVCGFQDLRVFATLVDLAESEQGRAYARDMLAPLQSARAGGGDLEQAVIAYIESGGNLNAAARDLHIHRNTMLYKLDRASRALQLDLREAEHQFAVWLAYKLNMLAETVTAVDRDVRPT